MSDVDLEQGCHHHSMTGNDMSMCVSDVCDGSCHSDVYSTNVVTYGNYNNACGFNHEITEVANSRRPSSVTDSSMEVEIGSEIQEVKVEKNCRICHLGSESESQELEAFITLGCSCKDDLSIAHKNCAETWFNIKGNWTCEICHSIALNVLGANEEITHTLSNRGSPTEESTHAPSEETRRFCHNHHFFGWLLVILLLIFVIVMIFHFNRSSS